MKGGRDGGASLDALAHGSARGLGRCRCPAHLPVCLSGECMSWMGRGPSRRPCKRLEGYAAASRLGPMHEWLLLSTCAAATRPRHLTLRPPLQVLDEQIVAFEMNIRIMKVSQCAGPPASARAVACNSTARSIVPRCQNPCAVCNELVQRRLPRWPAGVQDRPAVAAARPAAPAAAARAGGRRRPAGGCAGSGGLPTRLTWQIGVPAPDMAYRASQPDLAGRLSKTAPRLGMPADQPRSGPLQSKRLSCGPTWARLQQPNTPQQRLPVSPLLAAVPRALCHTLALDLAPCASVPHSCPPRLLVFVHMGVLGLGWSSS